MKNIKEKKCKNCKGRGFVPMGEGMKGLTQCPVCLGSGIVKKDSEHWYKKYEESKAIIRDLVLQLKGKACFSDTKKAEAFLGETLK